MQKLKIGFDPNSGVYQDFREMINHIYYDLNEQIELYSVSLNDDPTIELESKSFELQLDTAHILIGYNYQEISDILTNHNINIYLTNDIKLVDFLESIKPIVLGEDSVSGCKSILINNGLVDRYNFTVLYMKHLNFWTNRIYNTINGKKQNFQEISV